MWLRSISRRRPDEVGSSPRTCATAKQQGYRETKNLHFYDFSSGTLGMSHSSLTSNTDDSNSSGTFGGGASPNKTTRNRRSSNASDTSDSETGSSRSVFFRVCVPEGVRPGEEFRVAAGDRMVRVRCPLNTRPGQLVQIKVAEQDFHSNVDLFSSSPPSSPTRVSERESFGATSPSPEQLPDSPNVTRVPHSSPLAPAYMVRIPTGIPPGGQFPIRIAGQDLLVTCPSHSRPGDQVQICPPPPPPLVRPPSLRPLTPMAPSIPPDNTIKREDSLHQMQCLEKNRSPQDPNIDSQTTSPKTRDKDNNSNEQLFEVEVPPGVLPGRPFALQAAGQKVLVTCPLNAQPGSRIRFLLPAVLAQQPKHNPMLSKIAKIKLAYDKDGWMRTIRAVDMKFQWVRIDDKGEIDTSVGFHTEKSAFVRHLNCTTHDNNNNNNNISDPTRDDTTITLVSATKAAIDSCVKNAAGKELVSFAEIAEAQGKNFEGKAAWFEQKCDDLRTEWDAGHINFSVRRDFLLQDSMRAVMSLGPEDMRKIWKFRFIGETALDAGGVAREWFQLVTQQCFDPDLGFWQCSGSNQMCMQINPASKIIHEDYRMFYRFLGRVMGKALFDKQLVSGHMVQYMYKHILAWPITFKDLKSLDEVLYQNLQQLQELADMGQDLEDICLSFSITEELLDCKEVVDLVKGGADIPVTNDNFPKYFEAILKHEILDRVKPQLNALLLGFFDVIPEPLLTVFDFQELELLMCGLPTINLDDWMANTEYSGAYEYVGCYCQVVEWFWEVVDEFDKELQARLLQFVTGTAGVPARGFSVLQGCDGTIRRFTIHGVPLDACLYPRAHTCFNRIDLPVYRTKRELREKLNVAVTMSSSGFDLE